MTPELFHICLNGADTAFHVNAFARFLTSASATRITSASDASPFAALYTQQTTRTLLSI